MTDPERYSNDPKKQSFKIFAVAEILRVKGFYISGTRIKGISLSYTAPDGSKKTDAEIPTHILISFLSNSNWPLRANAAELLANRSEKGVPEALIKAFDDSNLDVRKIALDSFERITGFTRIDVFDFPRAKEWYAKNASEVEKKLKAADSNR